MKKIAITLVLLGFSFSALAIDQAGQCKEVTRQYNLPQELWCVEKANEGEFSDQLACTQSSMALSEFTQNKENALQYIKQNCLPPKKHVQY